MERFEQEQSGVVRHSLIRKGLSSLKRNGFRDTVRRTFNKIFGIDLKRGSAKHPIFSNSELEAQRHAAWRIAQQSPIFSNSELEAQRHHSFPKRIRISLIVPLYNTNEQYLREMIESVTAQTYPEWELCMADGSDNVHAYVEDICREYASHDKRICYHKLDRNRNISGNTNACIEFASGEYLGLLDHDDRLHPAALFEVMRAICEKDADLIYTDENTFRHVPEDAYNPHFKPAYAPDTLLSNNYICHFTVFRRSLLSEVGLFEPECDGSQDHDMVLRLTERAKCIVHIPEILYYWRAHPGSVSDDVSVKPYVIQAGIHAVERYLERNGLEGEVTTAKEGFPRYRVRYAIIGEPKISILIPNCDHLSDLKKCLNSIFERTSYRNFEIVIVENNSVSKEITDYYESVQKERPNVRVVKWEGDFNYSAINNYGAAYCTGEYLLLLNNDTQVITPDWIQEMLMFAQRSDVGAVGAKLLYMDNTIQHGGVCVGLGDAAGHYFLGIERDAPGYMARLYYAQNVSAVTGACMLVRRDVWDSVNGLDEHLAVAYNDVDLCLRIRKKGFLIVWTPFAELYHFESKSRESDLSRKNRKRYFSEVAFMHERWKAEMEAGDPYYNPNFLLEHGGFPIDPRPRPHEMRVMYNDRERK